ncbi:MAG: sugar phosphate isomerase/epimerase [Ruminococcaceae bacterium]|nr:sugar phosphate isomerase/epimerase [Oscillospiraceae bacterium]
MRISTEISSAALLVGEERAVEVMAKAGFDCYDFSMIRMAKYSSAEGRFLFEDHPLHGPDYLKFARRVRSVADSCGIPCNQSHAPFPSHRDQVVPYLQRAIECSAEVGAEICVIHPKCFSTAEENAEFYGTLLPFAKSCGVKIATENMWNWDKEKDEAFPCACSTAEDFVAHVDAVNDPFLVACLDIGHAEMRGLGTNAVEMIHALGPDRLKALHIHDNDKWHDSHRLPFTMDIDFLPIVRALKEIGYTGDFTLEVDHHLSEYGAERIEEGAKVMAQAVRKLADLFSAS